ncbi:MAG: TonB-dependent receptor [Candidatus Eisenbacteria bacterium]|uniref:TonB-dependent receptor n=1 Tax=Eiseniibacteriota bacterium TaxID=2212470 RepID=A0A849SJQ2_UNCEI|nr:TonB-dependent receptor [Candidatus Eisenbacteria bacterium]
MTHPIALALALFAHPLAAPADSASAVADSLVTADSLAVWSSALIPAPRRMTDSITVLPPVRVVADRAARDARSTTTQLRFTRGQIARFLPATAAEALLSAPGVDLIRTGAWSSQIAVRGMAGERVLVTVDGVRLSSGRGHSAQTSLVAVDRLDAIEMSPGSAGAAFGSDAIGGVVNLVTQRELFAEAPTLGATLSARATTPGSDAGGNARLRFRGPRFGAEISGGLASLEALVTPSGALANSGSRDEDLLGRMGARLGLVTLDLEHSHHAASDVGIPAFGDANGSRASYPLQAREATRFELKRPGDERWFPSVALLLSKQRFRTDFDEVTVGYDSLRGRRIATRTSDAYDRIRTDAQSARQELRFGPRGAVRVAGEWRFEASKGPRTTTQDAVNASGVASPTVITTGNSMPEAWRQAWALGASTSAERGSLRGEAGLRYDHHRTHSDEFPIPEDPGNVRREIDARDRRWSAEAGLARPIGMWEPYVHVASGFRVPSLEERFFNSDIHGGMHVFGNDTLRAERSGTGEVGVRLTGDRGALRVSAYRSDVHDLIALVYQDLVFGRPTFVYKNVERARLEGLELTARWNTRRALLAVQAAVPRGEDLDNGRRLTDIGESRVTLDVGVPLAARWFPLGMLSLRGRWTDAVPVDDRSSDGERQALPRPASWTFAAEAAATVANTRITLAVRNLLDHTYREPLGFIEEPGRTVTLAVRRDLELPWRDRSGVTP